MVVTAVIGFFLFVLAAFGYLAYKYLGRPPDWLDEMAILVTFVFLVGLLIVSFLERRRGRPVECRQCHEVNLASAPYCKHCGASLG